MSSQWVINNKKVKDWTIGGKKVKSITFANGKVLNFVTKQIKTLKATDYESWDIVQSLFIGFSGVKTHFFFDLGASGSTPHTPDEPFIIEFKGGYETDVNRLIFLNIDRNQGLTVSLSGSFTIEPGHKYQFENGKDPVDLGTY